MNRELNDLYDYIYQDESTIDSRNFINRIEGKTYLIEETLYEDYEDLKIATRHLSDYGIMLYKSGYLNKALNYIELAIAKFENDRNINIADLLEEPLYEKLIFHRGMALYNLKKHNEANIDFQRLIKYFPNNDKYNSWIKGIKAQRYSLIEWGFAFFAIVCIILSMYFEPKDGIIEKLSLYGIIVGLAGGLLTNFLRKRLTRIK
jgi:tetratricopeptide (TPR) repeat protein